ncbi:cache domain-containing sensor histidine kinase [Paenibacillus humicola]|uniref:cache domain-containing sensor histidine kinase n=1 Tax=Paenibacillus humicola TaxID=3110540 RepID=UPI00237C05FB|nr:sensor histidine kinase [Paenibacillus humicola]
MILIYLRLITFLNGGAVLPFFSFINRSLQRKIFVYFIVAALFPTAVISISSYLISVDIVKAKVSDSIVESLGYIRNSIENELKQVEQISSYMYISSDIKQILAPDFKENTPASYYAMVKANEAFSLYSIHSRDFSYISSIQVLGENGVNLLYGEEVNHFDRRNLKQLESTSWFREVKKLNGKIYWIGNDANFDSTNSREKNKVLISMARMIKDVNMDDNVGMIYISLDNTVFKEMLGNSTVNSASRIFIIDNHGKTVYAPETPEENESALNLKLIKLQPNKHGYLIDFDRTGVKQLVAYYYISRYDWWVIETIPYHVLVKDNKMIFEITASVFIVCLLLSGLIWYFLSLNIVKPVKQLIETMRSIREDRLPVKSTIRSKDEIGVLSSSYNYMIERIHELFQSVLEEQAMKKDAEYKALQAQINPHFLFNTLNSIRWMALIQKANNIKETIDALGRLLQNSTNKVDPYLTIEEELQNLKDYISIQKMRYKDKFDVQYDVDESLLPCKCIKFLLQPLVENAIFHGIEPKQGFGTILIRIAKDGDRAVFIVRDDGIGMDAHKINELLNMPCENKTGFSGIGIRNVNERVKLTYGDPFGITINSSLQQFTEIMLVLPIQKDSGGA